MQHAPPYGFLDSIRAVLHPQAESFTISGLSDSVSSCYSEKVPVKAHTTRYPTTSKMASPTWDGGSHEDEIRLWQEDDWWIARDVETGVTTQGESKEEALEHIDDAVAQHDGEHGRTTTDGELRAVGIDPAENTTGDREPPDVLELSDGAADLLRA